MIHFSNGDIVETVDDRPIWKRTKDWFLKKKDAAVDTIKLYPKESFAVATVIVGGAVKVLPKLLIARNNRERERIKQEYCYDRSLGHYWALKRALSTSEWIEINKRRSNGENLGDILEQLNVLK